MKRIKKLLKRLGPPSERKPSPPVTDRAIPGQLLDSADAVAGSDPREAEALRASAEAYLRVVR